MYPWTRSWLNFGNNPNQESGSGFRITTSDPDLIGLAAGMRCPSAVVDIAMCGMVVSFLQL